MKKQITLTLPDLDVTRAWRFAQKWLLPNPGTLIWVVLLLLTLPALARSSQNLNAASISTIPYQGRLADASGNPITGKQNMEFRLYDVPVGGVPLWEEFWTGANSVDVSDGLFSVMLGSVNTGLAAAVQGHNSLYLGITVGTDSEMTPRVQLGSVPFSIWSLTVADDSITSTKIADDAVTSAHISANAIDTSEIADGAVTLPKMGEQPYYFHGAFATPSEWMADVIFNGNYPRFCTAIGRSYFRADELQSHYHPDRGVGFFYTNWYYTGTRYCASDVHKWGDGNPNSVYNVWQYKGDCGCCPAANGVTFERSAIIWCN